MSRNDVRARAIEAELAALENALEHRYNAAFPKQRRQAPLIRPRQCNS
jgi:hypothetical protein